MTLETEARWEISGLVRNIGPRRAVRSGQWAVSSGQWAVGSGQWALKISIWSGCCWDRALVCFHLGLRGLKFFFNSWALRQRPLQLWFELRTPLPVGSWLGHHWCADNGLLIIDDVLEYDKPYNGGGCLHQGPTYSGYIWLYVRRGQFALKQKF